MIQRHIFLVPPMNSTAVDLTFFTPWLHLVLVYNNSKRTRSRGRPTTYKKRPSNLDCHTCDMALYIVVRKVEAAKANKIAIYV
jgi:hypothetical protein